MCRAMAENYQNSLERLKNLRAKVNWEFDDELRVFIRRLCDLIENWKGPLPNLREIFRPTEIDWLLMQYVKDKHFSPIFEFIINTGYKDEPEVDENGKPLLNRRTAVHCATANHGFISRNIFIELFKVYDNFDANYIDDRGGTHFHAACAFGCYDAVEKFLERGQDPNYPESEKTFKPLIFALVFHSNEVAELLLRSGADPNVARPSDKSTALHMICMREDGAGLAEILFEVSNKNHRPVNVDPLDTKGRTPLHLALSTGSKQVAKLLLKNGADPVLATPKGSTLLHFMCRRYNYLDDELAEILFEVSNKNHRPVNIDALDKKGQTPLHLALMYGNKQMAKLLLQKGADPMLVTPRGWTPLHIISVQDNYEDLAELLFNLNDDILQVDARDNVGKTPLHCALSQGNKNMTELLLRKGSDPNLTTNDGLTPLHIACEREQSHHDDTPKFFFEIMDELRLEVQIDARDKKGRTPLQYAVVSLSPKTVDVLLDHGADLSGFVFPAEAPFTKYIQWCDTETFEFKLELTSGLLGIVECLQKRGYVLDRSNVLKIMEWLAKHEVFEESTDVKEQSWYKGDDCAAEAKKIMMNQNVSLYDLIRLRPHEVPQLLTYEDCLRFARTDRNFDLYERLIRNAATHDVCETISKNFFRRWALDSFLELTRHQLPILCCEKIIYLLKNEDLFKICLTANIVAKEESQTHDMHDKGNGV